MPEISKQCEQQLIMQNRNQLDLTGVLDVDSFDENVVMVKTSLGELSIRGQNLQVQRLDVEGGLLTVEGKIDSLTYSTVTHGLFGRLLR